MGTMSPLEKVFEKISNSDGWEDLGYEEKDFTCVAKHYSSRSDVTAISTFEADMDQQYYIKSILFVEGRE